MGKLIGIDDAGRGPVLGPMVLAGVLIEEEEEEIIGSWGAKDSKLLTPKKRFEIKEKVIEKFEHFIVTSKPIEIDESSNLNYLEAIKTSMIINHLMEPLNEKVRVIVDCPSVNIEAWSEDVFKLVEKKDLVDLFCEHKADYNHKIVSAASILAKEKREAELVRLRRELDVDFGSGYPADPKTKEFIAEHFENPKYKDIIRFSWNTVKRLVKAKKSGQKKLF
ncbi:ribonuclease HII [archaeon]|jgi:ribonuclease HII|nr:ribonuclease HII [archaeon]MBT6182467.1 ribonuclease HII [archaeon]MBT6606296.1 ribonuclease HII [archaeon]MBT7251535.1 ribonuclease HII [archaeon]MBT7661176.1 ribonuclease HII [archaeon]